MQTTFFYGDLLRMLIRAIGQNKTEDGQNLSYIYEITYSPSLPHNHH